MAYKTWLFHDGRYVFWTAVFKGNRRVVFRVKPDQRPSVRARMVGLVGYKSLRLSNRGEHGFWLSTHLNYPPKDWPYPRNRAMCLKCGTIVESFTVHDFKRCSCGALAVDGGTDYFKRNGNRADIKEMP